MLGVVFLLIIFNCKSRALEQYHMTTVYVDRQDGSTCVPNEFTTIRGLSGYIISHDSSLVAYKPSQQCFLIIEVPEGYQIAIEALEFDLGYPPGTEKCLSDSLFLFDNQPENGKIFDSNLHMFGEYCGTKNDRSKPSISLATSSNNSITLYWHAAELAQRYPSAKGFTLKWFAVKGASPSKFSAPSVENVEIICDPNKDFVCPNGQSCIPLPMACQAELYCKGSLSLIRKTQVEVGCETGSELDSFSTDHNGLMIAAILASLIVSALLTFFLLTRWRRSSRSKSNPQKTLQKQNSAVHADKRGGAAAQRALLKTDAGGSSSCSHHDQAVCRLDARIRATDGESHNSAPTCANPSSRFNQTAQKNTREVPYAAVCCFSGSGVSADSKASKTTLPGHLIHAQDVTHPQINLPGSSKHATRVPLVHGSSTSADSNMSLKADNRRLNPALTASPEGRLTHDDHYNTTAVANDFYESVRAPVDDSSYSKGQQQVKQSCAYPSEAQSYCSVAGYVRATEHKII